MGDLSISTRKNRIKIYDAPTVAYFDPNDASSEDDNNLKIKSQAFQRLKGTYKPQVDTLLASLGSFIKDNFKTDIKVSPAENYAMKQVCLAACALTARLKSEKLGYDDLRDHFENLACLLELLEKRNSKLAVTYLADVLSRLIGMCGPVTAILEDISQKHETEWELVSKYYRRYAQKNVVPRCQFNLPHCAYYHHYSLLAVGSFGTVHTTKMGQQLTACVKVVTKEKVRTEFQRNKTIRSLTSVGQIGYIVRHPLWTIVYSTYVTMEAFVTVMEFVRGVDCQRICDHVTRMPSNIVTLVIAQVCLAIEYLHYVGFIHRDIRPSNIMITGNVRVKVCDYDTVKVCTGMFSTRLMTGFLRRTVREFSDGEYGGCLGFFAPEVLAPKSGYGRSIDWWAIGVTTYALLIGAVPFRGNTDEEIKKNICSGVVDFKYQPPPKAVVNDDSDEEVPKMRGGSADMTFENTADLHELIRDFLKLKPSERLCSANYSQYRKHNAFKKINIEWVERSEKISQYAPMLSLMQADDQGAAAPRKVPATSAEKADTSNLLTLEKLNDIRDAPAILLFVSEGFQKALDKLVFQQPVNNEMLYHQLETIGAFEDTPYKFKEFFRQTRYKIPTNKSKFTFD